MFKKYQYSTALEFEHGVILLKSCFRRKVIGTNLKLDITILFRVPPKKQLHCMCLYFFDLYLRITESYAVI